eukprot:TRINITY_DN18539_c0_g1_i1.p1 TRINITY_DN18539_c0_g1~~TRINITY_DN18539_c0_g1_i1.p1  ORF type:complete len:854 (+),score=155.56 TRINITY_DN18539_c0_g1_i1:94-2562(+)
MNLPSADEVLGESIAAGLSSESLDNNKNRQELEAKVREAMVTHGSEGGSNTRVQQIIGVLEGDYLEQGDVVSRKGGLQGIAAVAFGLDKQVHLFLPQLLGPVLQLLQDQGDPRVRYFACEVAYNICKVAGDSVLPHFDKIFNGLCRLRADPVDNIKNAAAVLDRVMKDIVTQNASKFGIATFAVLMAERLKNTNPNIRQLMLAWIQCLLACPEIDLISYLSQFLEGLFKILEDQQRDIRQNAHATLQKILDMVKASPTGKKIQIVSETTGILVESCKFGAPRVKLQALCWLHEYLHLRSPTKESVLENDAEASWSLQRPSYSSAPELTQLTQEEENSWRASWATHMPKLLAATLHCLCDHEETCKMMAVEMNNGLIDMASSLKDDLPVDKLVEQVLESMETRDGVQASTNRGGHDSSFSVHTACLQWICMLLSFGPKQMLERRILQSLLKQIFWSLMHEDDEVVVSSLRVLAEIMKEGKNGAADQDLFDEDLFDDSEGHIQVAEGAGQSASSSALASKGEAESKKSSSDLFTMVLHRLLTLFSSNRERLETRGRLMIRQLCGHLDPRRLYVTVARAIQKEEDKLFAKQLVQTFSWILLTAVETLSLREELLREASLELEFSDSRPSSSPEGKASATDGKSVAASNSDGSLFMELIEPWFHNPVSALALCLWSGKYEMASELTARLAAFEPTLDLLQQLDQLVHLIESPVFSRLRLRLLEPRKHPVLIKCLLGLAMLLPQAGAFNILRERIQVVQSSLLLEVQHDGSPHGEASKGSWWSGAAKHENKDSHASQQMDTTGVLLERFEEIAAEYTRRMLAEPLCP